MGSDCQWLIYNKNQQYIGCVEYRSLVLDKSESIKVEISLREPLLRTPELVAAKTIVQDPFVSGRSIVPPYRVQAMSLMEAYAEKVRAALTRREPAIRDFFDVDYAVRKLKLRADDAEWLGLVEQKLAVLGTGPVDVSEKRMDALREQVEPQLRPVLRKKDLAEFDVDRAIQLITHLAAHCKS